MTPATVRSAKGAIEANLFTGKLLAFSQFLLQNEVKFSTTIAECIARSHSKFKGLDLTINKRGIEFKLLTSQTLSKGPYVTFTTERLPMNNLHRYRSGNIFNQLRLRSKLELVITKTGHIGDSI